MAGARKNAPPREDVLAAAMGMIAERGLEQLTMAALGREVGMSSGHLLYYFHSKDELLLQALEWSEGRLGAERGRLLTRSTATSRERVDAYVDLYVPDGHRDPHWTLWLEVWNRSQNADDDARDRQAAIEGVWHRDLVALIAEGVSRGVPGRRPGPVRGPAPRSPRRFLHPCGDRAAGHGPGASSRPRTGVPGRGAPRGRVIFRPGCTQCDRLTLWNPVRLHPCESPVRDRGTTRFRGKPC